MYSNRENKRLSIFSISLALLLGASNISLVTYLVSTANHKSIPSFDIPVGPYTSYRLTATKNGYTLSYRANDPKKLLTRTRTSTPKGLFGGKTAEVEVFEENTILGKVGSKEGEVITDEMIACIKTEGAGESTGRLIGTSIGTKAAPAVTQVPIVGWLAAGWVAMLSGNKGADVGGNIAKSFNDC